MWKKRQDEDGGGSLIEATEVDGRDGPDRSPEILAAPPKRGAGVRRMNSKPVLFVGAAVGVTMLILGYSMHMRAAEQERRNAPQAEKSEKFGAGGVEPAVLTGAPTSGIVPAGAGQDGLQVELASDTGPVLLVDDRERAAGQLTGAPMAAPAGGQAPVAATPAVYTSPYEAQWRQYDQARAAIQQARFERAAQAYGADSAVDVGQRGGQGAPAATNPVSAALAALSQAAGAGANAASPASAPSGDVGEQGRKRAFMAGAGEPEYYSPSRVEAPLSQTELKAGSVIPAVLVGGVTSDLPGQIVGQVTRNVFDSTTGRYLLIPQGSKLIGVYDNSVSYGQSRVMVAWQRLILPDGASFTLGSMPGADQGGNAGFNDKVNNHYGRAFGSALMVSLFSAGLQLSQPQASNGENYSPGQTAAGAIGQEVGQLGMEVARKNLSVQPTLQIRPGYRFNVQVTKDLIMREWRPR